MAKGNMFQGMARGKVGDVVFYRMNGWQMARVRNRKPKNPRTPEQMYQRAIIATVMKVYSAGKEIFDHAFEDYRVGEENMRRFNSLNAIHLRNMIKQEITNATDETESNVRVVGPKSPSPVAYPELIISEGSLANNFMTVHTRMTSEDAFEIKTASVLEGETVKQYFNRLGIYNDDIFTIVAFNMTNEVVSSVEGITSPYSKQYNTVFGWVRLKITGDINSNSPASEATLGSLVTIEIGGMGMIANFNNTKLGGSIYSGEIFDRGIYTYAGTVGVIRSKNNSMLRSTASMKWKGIADHNAYGITTEWILDAWMKEKDQIGQSELILEGGEPYNIMNELSDEIEVQKEEESKKRKK